MSDSRSKDAGKGDSKSESKVESKIATSHPESLKAASKKFQQITKLILEEKSEVARASSQEALIKFLLDESMSPEIVANLIAENSILTLCDCLTAEDSKNLLKIMAKALKAEKSNKHDMSLSKKWIGFDEIKNFKTLLNKFGSEIVQEILKLMPNSNDIISILMLRIYSEFYLLDITPNNIRFIKCLLDFQSNQFLEDSTLLSGENLRCDLRIVFAFGNQKHIEAFIRKIGLFNLINFDLNNRTEKLEECFTVNSKKFNKMNKTFQAEIDYIFSLSKNLIDTFVDNPERFLQFLEKYPANDLIKATGDNVLEEINNRIAQLTTIGQYLKRHVEKFNEFDRLRYFAIILAKLGYLEGLKFNKSGKKDVSIREKQINNFIFIRDGFEKFLSFEENYTAYQDLIASLGKDCLEKKRSTMREPVYINIAAMNFLFAAAQQDHEHKHTEMMIGILRSEHEEELKQMADITNPVDATSAAEAKKKYLQFFSPEAEKKSSEEPIPLERIKKVVLRKLWLENAIEILMYLSNELPEDASSKKIKNEIIILQGLYQDKRKHWNDSMFEKIKASHNQIIDSCKKLELDKPKKVIIERELILLRNAEFMINFILADSHEYLLNNIYIQAEKIYFLLPIDESAKEALKEIGYIKSLAQYMENGKKLDQDHLSNMQNSCARLTMLCESIKLNAEVVKQLSKEVRDLELKIFYLNAFVDNLPQNDLDISFRQSPGLGLSS